MLMSWWTMGTALTVEKFSGSFHGLLTVMKERVLYRPKTVGFTSPLDAV